MRLWSLHPAYLDAKGLVALWREALLAKAVLRNLTRGYRRHPQLERFRACADPVPAIDRYLRGVYEEGVMRGYRFDPGKLGENLEVEPIPVTQGQLVFEWGHPMIALPRPHPLFYEVAGGVAPWERGGLDPQSA